MPVNSRARSGAALANDKKILDAALAEAGSSGLDGLGFGSVSARAGKTTGAMYSRYADSGDLVAALWQERLKDPVETFLVEAMGAMTQRPGTCGAEIVQRVEKMSTAEKVGLEAIMIAPRFPQLDEVLAEDVTTMLSQVGIRSPGDHVTGCAVIGLATLLGCVTQRNIQRDLSVWDGVINVVSLSMSLAEPAGGKVPRLPQAARLRARTDSDLRNVLFDAVADVVARSGVTAATVARISRRARMTSGAVYTLYDSRDELVLDAMEHMLGQAVADAAGFVRRGEERDEVADATATLIAFSTSPERAQWRRFRLETYVAARTNRSIAAVLKRVQSDGHDRYVQMFAANPRMSQRAVAMLSRSGQNQPLGLSTIEPYVPGLATLDYRPYSVALLKVRDMLAGA